MNCVVKQMALTAALLLVGTLSATAAPTFKTPLPRPQGADTHNALRRQLRPRTEQARQVQVLWTDGHTRLRAPQRRPAPAPSQVLWSD